MYVCMSKIYNHKPNWKDATWCPMAYEPFFKSQKQLHFNYFGMSLKMDDINVFFILIFIQINISCKSKLHMQLQTIYNFLCKLFLLNSMEDNHICSHKNHWFGHKSQTYGLEWTWFIIMFKVNLFWEFIHFFLMFFY
jgi:hypothetical protein